MTERTRLPLPAPVFMGIGSLFGYTADQMRDYAAAVSAADNAALREEVREISGGVGVLMGILVDCAAVLRTIDPDDSDEVERLRDLLDAIDRALEPSRHKGELL